MSNEIETRAIISESQIDIIRDLIHKIGFEKVEEFIQTDIIIDNKDGALFKNEQKIRIRVEKGIAELTYKGKFEGNTEYISKRKEIDIPFDTKNVDDLLNFFNCIGFYPLFQILKKREIYSFKDIHINIDKWPIIGFLLELEGEKVAIKEIMELLKPKLILKNYRLKEMFELRVNETGKSFEVLKNEYENESGFQLGQIELIFS